MTWPCLFQLLFLSLFVLHLQTVKGVCLHEELELFNEYSIRYVLEFVTHLKCILIYFSNIFQVLCVLEMYFNLLTEQ